MQGATKPAFVHRVAYLGAPKPGEPAMLLDRRTILAALSVPAA
jgi:hypothetical protein